MNKRYVFPKLNLSQWKRAHKWEETDGAFPSEPKNCCLTTLCVSKTVLPRRLLTAVPVVMYLLCLLNPVL